MPGLMFGSPVLTLFVSRVDGVATGLNAIGFAIMDAGFDGICGFAVSERDIAWQFQLDTPEGVYFAGLCNGSVIGKSFPPIAHVLATIRAMYFAPERGAK